MWHLQHNASDGIAEMYKNKSFTSKMRSHIFAHKTNIIHQRIEHKCEQTHLQVEYKGILISMRHALPTHIKKTPKITWNIVWHTCIYE